MDSLNHRGGILLNCFEFLGVFLEAEPRFAEPSACSAFMTESLERCREFEWMRLSS